VKMNSDIEQQLKQKEQRIKELTLQIEHQQAAIEEYEKRLQYFQTKRKRGRPALLEEQRQQVRVLVNQGMSYRKVHEITGISLGMISSIMQGEAAKEE
jgi:uncharacterized protein YerC